MKGLRGLLDKLFDLGITLGRGNAGVHGKDAGRPKSGTPFQQDIGTVEQHGSALGIGQVAHGAFGVFQ